MRPTIVTGGVWAGNDAQDEGLSQFRICGLSPAAGAPVSDSGHDGGCRLVELRRALLPRALPRALREVGSATWRVAR